MADPLPTEDLVALAARGDAGAGYELLGRQATVAEWIAVLERLSALAAAAQQVDLELVARRTARRPVAVVAALLDLCEAVHTAQSLFVVRAVESLRGEQTIRQRARTTAEHLLPHLTDLAHEPDSAPSDPSEAFYYLLSQPLTDQKERWNHTSADVRTSIVAAIRAERDRLRDLTKDASASSGSYLHFLRHRLADLVLACGIGDDVGEWAYRILQLRTEDLDDLRPLLRAMPQEGRQRYISWAVTPRKGAPVDRIRFLLSFAGEEFPDDLDSDALLVLATHPDPLVAADSLVLALELRKDDAAITTLASTSIADLPRDDAVRVASALLRIAPQEIKIAKIPLDRVDLVRDTAGDRHEALARAITSQIATLPDAEAVLAWVKTLERLTIDDERVFAEAAKQVIEEAAVDPRPEAAARSLERLLEAERFRDAFWTVLNDVPASVLSHLTTPLLHKDDPQTNARKLGVALDQLTGEHYAILRAAAIDGTCDGTVDPGDIAAVWPAADRDPTASELRRRIDQAESDLGRLQTEVVDIDAAIRRELADNALPTIRDAVASSAANAGIQDIYRRLAGTLERPRDDGAAERTAKLPSGIASQLAPDRPHAERLDTLLKLDAEARDVVGSANAKALLAQDDFAEHVLRDLFERGAMFQIAVRLSADTRIALLDAAITTGFQPPAAWSDHPALGLWLRQELARRTPTNAELQAETDLTAIFRNAATTFAKLHALQGEVAARRGAVSRELAAQLAPLVNELNATVDAYYQVWRSMRPIGWRPVEVIGHRLHPEQLDPDRHQILAGHGRPLFVVRRTGLQVDDQVVERAQLEGVDA